MRPMSMTVWTFLLLASAGVHGLGSSDEGHATADHDHEPHGHETTDRLPAAGSHGQDQGGREEHDHEQEEGHGGQQASERSAGEQHDEHDRRSKDDGHGHSDEHGHTEDEPGEVHLSPDQLKTLNVRTERLLPRALGETLRAPGEVRLNALQTGMGPYMRARPIVIKPAKEMKDETTDNCKLPRRPADDCGYNACGLIWLGLVASSLSLTRPMAPQQPKNNLTQQ